MDSPDPTPVIQPDLEHQPHWRDQADGFADDDTDLHTPQGSDSSVREWSLIR